MPNENQPTCEKRPVSVKRSVSEKQTAVRKRSSIERQPTIEKPLAGLRFNPIGALQDNYQRDVVFAVRDAQGGETSCPEPATAKFDTGCEEYNLISKNFVEAIGDNALGDFEPLGDTWEEQLDTPDGSPINRDHSLWKSCKRRLSRLYRKLTRKDQLSRLVTLDGQPIRVVGILRNTRWRGINLDPSVRGQMIRFPGKYLRHPTYTEFLVVENLKWDVVFGLPTINHLQDQTPFGIIAAGALAKAPNHSPYKRVRPGFLPRAPSGMSFERKPEGERLILRLVDSADRERQQREKREQELLLGAQE